MRISRDLRTAGPPPGHWESEPRLASATTTTNAHPKLAIQVGEPLRVVQSLAHPPVGEVVSVNAHRGELSEHIADGLAAGHPLTLPLTYHH